MATVLLTACGGDSDSGQTAGAESSTATATAAAPHRPDGADHASSSPHVFPKPKAPPGSPPGADEGDRRRPQGLQGQDAAAGAGRVHRRSRRRASATDQEEDDRELPKYEKQAAHSPDFVAGQLAAGVYEATLPEKQTIAGYQGCVYELALQLRRELAKKQG